MGMGPPVRGEWDDSMQDLVAAPTNAAGAAAQDVADRAANAPRHIKSVSKHVLRLACVGLVGGLLASCGSSPPQQKAKFSPEKYGVKASPRMVAAGKPVPKGGGRYVVGKKYKIAGKWYYPKHDPNYTSVGLASWYGPTFHGRKTANGEIFDRNALTAAHTTMPLPSYARVTNLENNRSMIVRVNDRGPFHGNRTIDLSERVADMLGTKAKGVAKVKVEYVGRARLDGLDEKYLMASYSGPGAVTPSGTRPGTLIAQAVPPQLLLGGATPTARPYPSATQIASNAGGASYQVAFDPAIAFENSAGTVRLAGANTFTPSAIPSAGLAGPQHGTGQGTLGLLPVLEPSAPQAFSGSALSSYTARRRIADAHAVFGFADRTAVPLAELARRATNQ